MPASYVAFVGDKPVGSVVLVEHDMPGLEDLAHLSPWLAGLYVRPEFRHRGIGTGLVSHAQAEARRFLVDRLHAYTSTVTPLYTRLGWKPVAVTDYEGQAVTILTKDLTTDR